MRRKLEALSGISAPSVCRCRRLAAGLWALGTEGRMNCSSNRPCVKHHLLTVTHFQQPAADAASRSTPDYQSAVVACI